MKKERDIGNLVVIILLIIIVSLPIVIRAGVRFCVGVRPTRSYPTRVWNSKYTEQEHTERVRRIMQKIYGDDAVMSIYTVYSIDEYPEFYLVEIPEKDQHQILLCYNDEYYFFHGNGGLSWWSRFGVVDNPEYKKYIGVPTTIGYKYKDEFYGGYIDTTICDRVVSRVEKSKFKVLRTGYAWGWYDKINVNPDE